MAVASRTTLEVKTVDPLVGEEWDEEVSSHERATVFHSSAWARVLAGTYHHAPVYLRFAREGKLVALVPIMELRSWPKGTRGVSLPFADFCEPLLFDDCVMDELKDELTTLARRKEWRYAELRGPLAGTKSAREVDSASFVGHDLDLTGDDSEQFGRLDSAARRSVRKAERSGLKVVVSETWSSMQKFFRLHEVTRRRHGVPPQPRSFFQQIHAALLDHGKGFVSLVEKDGSPVAGAVFLTFGSRAVYKFGASDGRFLGERPNHLAIWEGIRALMARKCNLLQFGRTSAGQEGLRRFKRSWGAQETGLDYLRLETESGKWSVKPSESSPSRIAGLQFMPLPFGRLAGRLLYPRLD